MKRLLAAALAVLLMLSITISAFAADSPLAASDRITAQLTDIQKRREEIEKTISQRETAKKVATFRGKNMTESQGLNYFINRKIMTKRDFEAFKWSFIFSQFAVPLEDSLLDVLSDEVVNKMIEDNFTITGVKEFIITGSSDNDETNTTNEISMLQDTNVPELVETIKENYAVYPIFKENGSQPTLGDIINSQSLSVFEKFYLKDTLVEQTPNNISKDSANSLFYNQDLLEACSKDINIEDVDIPIFVYDANSYMYLQIGIGAYLKSHGDKSKAELLAERGEEILCIDSYGNICSKSASGTATILLPNFGNSFLNAREASDNSSLLKESINLYNKWFVTLYTRHSRDDNKIYPDITKVECIDIVTNTVDSDGSMILKGDTIQSHYNNYITVNTGNDISNTLLLVETGAATTYPSSIGEKLLLYIINKIPKDNNISTFRIPLSHYDARGKMSDSYSAVSIINDFYSHIKEYPDLYLQGKWKSNATDSWHNSKGILRSPYNYSIEHYAPFTAIASQDVFLNKYPILNIDIDIDMLSVDASNKLAAYTHFDRYDNSLEKATWKINGSHYKSSPTSENENSASLAIGTDDIITLITSFKDDQILDNRFASAYQSKGLNGIYNTEVYLPKDLLDVGQNMEAYISDEKGMFLADYKTYFAGNFNFFKKVVSKVGEKLAENLGNMKEGKQLTEGDISNGLPDYIDDSDRNKVYLEGNTATIFMYNDTNASKNSEFQRYFYVPWTFELENAFDQEHLRLLWEYEQNINGIGPNKISPSVTKLDLYAVYTIEKDGDDLKRTFSELSDKPIDKLNEDGTGTESDHLDTIYYYISTNAVYDGTTNGSDKVFFPQFDKKTNGDGAPSLGKFQELVKSKVGKEDPDFEALYTKLEGLKDQKPYGDSKYGDRLKCAIAWNIAVAVSNALRNWADKPTESLETFLSTTQKYFGLDPNVVINTIMCLFNYTDVLFDSPDIQNNNLHNNYFYDEYQYFLRNPTYLSNALGYKTSNGDPTSNDFATITYFWDRHYLLQAAFNNQVMKEVKSNWEGASKQSPKSMSSIYQDYMNDIEQNHFGVANQSLQDFVLSQSPNLFGATISDKTIYTPYFYEWAIQDRNQNPNATISEQLESVNSVSQEGNNSNTQSNTGNNSDEKISSIFGSTSSFYNYLDADTVILYPFSRIASDITSSHLLVKAGLGDAVIDYAASTEPVRQDNSLRTVKTDLVATILALQCNTDYKHNNLTVAAAKPAGKTHVTKEELMDNANQFFTNPVTSISYIFTGFLYQVHAVIATGNIGSVFSINWLLESDAYKWVMNRYVAILAIAVGAILLLKLIQFAMNKSKDAMAIGRSIAGILAMCLVPVIIFNSFVWAFDTSSKWFMHGSLDKILLSQIDIKERERINSDPGVTAELNAFKEQFNALDLNGSECILFEEMTGYSLENGPIYKTVGIWDYMDNVIYTADDKGDWFTSKEFKSIHKDRYKESVFYYFYDFIRAEYFNYCSTVGTGGNTAIIKEYVREMEAQEETAQDKTGSEQLEAIKDINTSEQSIAMLTGGFRTMLEDTAYVYGDTLLENNKHITNGPKVKDLVGLYKIFNSAETDADVGEILKSVYYTAWENSSTMKATDSVVPKTWKDATYLNEYFSSNTNSKLQRGQASYNGMPVGKYYIITSYLDLFNKAYNNMDMTGLTINDIAITPLEEKLCALSDDIYNTTLKALNYLPDKIHDESAITLMAMIATCKLNEAFGVAPAEPVLESVTLDSFVRTAFLTDLEMVGSNVNTLYAMIAQGDSIGKVLVVVFLELIICVASVARILIILYITGASFVILGLRLLHKAPRTTDLVYGIVGNMLMLLALHAITLFLVIIAVEAVAGAVSVVPSILLDILMIVFTIMMAVTLFKLVKNIAKDAINIGGAKIKGLVHSIGDTVANAIKSVTHSKDNEINAANVTINSQTTSETPAIISEALVERRREHVNTIVQNIKQVEEEESAEAAESTNTQQASQVEKNLQAEREVEDS